MDRGSLTGEGASPAGYDLFELARRCLTATTVDEKLALTARAKAARERDELISGPDGEAPLPIEAVRFPERPLMVDPRELPRRKLTSREGRAALLHAVAHIEFTAIQLAWDILYRFRGLPAAFYWDWLAVAAEEAEHFELLRRRLRELGCDYGDLPVHRGLWDVAVDTADDVAARLALVPRCMEARGLDVTPGMIARLEQAGDQESAVILQRILKDEVGHVALGSRWFRWVCARRGAEPEASYLGFLQSRLRSEVRGPFNRELRLAAGFSAAELDRLASGLVGSAGPGEPTGD